MIVQQNVSGRPATVAYLTSDFEPANDDAYDFAKVIFDDGEVVFLIGPDPGIAEAQGFSRHRARQAAPLIPPPPDEGELEAAAFSRHRARHAAVFVPVESEPVLPEEVIEPEIETVADLPVKLQLVAWAKAIMVLDASEVLVRDLIERELAGKTGDFAKFQPMRVLAITRRLCAQIKDIREEAVKTAFRLLRARLGNVPVLTVPLASWAAYFAQQDFKAIEAAIQLGLADGLDNTEIARKVVGSMGLNGVDGVTEFIRHKIAHLGRASIRASQYAKQGEPGLT
jgi:hypothetical protein